MPIAEGVILGRLRSVEIRSVWPAEASYFTPWLAENLDSLGEALGKELILEGVEVAVGPFRADIIAKEGNGDEEALVIIENQFGTTDHDHAGKLLTYAAGLKAKTIIWIAENFREEHRAAIDYLNEMTRDEYSFFAVTVQAMRIGEHLPVAPHFTVLARPNNWSKRVATAQKQAVQDSPNEREAILESYWTKLLIEESERYPRWRSIAPRRVSNQRLESIRGGNPGVVMYASFSSQGLRIEVYIDGLLAKRGYDNLVSKRVEIEQIFGSGLVWERLEERRASRVSALLPDAHYSEADDWDRQHAWIIDNFERVKTVFQPYMLGLDVTSNGTAQQYDEDRDEMP